jgi:hypothetical protein
MKRYLQLLGVVISGTLFLLTMSACNGIPTPFNDFTASLTPSFNPIEDFRTIEPSPTAELTVIPTLTSHPEDIQPTATTTPAPTFTSPPPTLTPTNNIPCNRASPGYPSIDVEIDDNTVMLPGQRFTKVWRLLNSGACTWTPDYKAVWFFGANLSDTVSVPLRESVAPGESIDILVDMIAPSDAGSYQSNWKLQDETGETFGIGPTGSSPFWVRIVVVHTPTPTFTPSPPPTATATPTETPAPTPTPPVRLTGTAELNVGDRIELDTGQVNPDAGEDLEYQVDDLDAFWLIPSINALLGVYGDSEPTLLACEQTPIASASIGFGSLDLGTYLCFQTDEGYLGWLKWEGVNPDTHMITIEFLVWEIED